MRTVDCKKMKGRRKEEREGEARLEAQRGTPECSEVLCPGMSGPELFIAPCAARRSFLFS